MATHVATFKLASCLALLLAALLASAPTASAGSGCVSRRYDFANDAIFDDFEYEQGNYDLSDNTFTLLMKPVKTLPSGQPVGGMAGFMSKQKIKYGRFAARMKAAPLRGSISYLMTLNRANKDEIDIEFVGRNLNEFQSNVFDKNQIYVVNGKPHATGNDASTNFHDYEFVWTEDDIKWYLDGNLVRTLTREGTIDQGGSRQIDPKTGKEVSVFPSSESNVFIGMWDSVGTNQQGTIEWAGGPGTWTDEWKTKGVPFSFQSLEIQCIEDFKAGRKPALAKASGKGRPKGPANSFVPIGPTGGTNMTHINPDDLFDSAAVGGRAGVLSELVLVVAVAICAVLF